MARLTRHELKKDELAARLQAIRDFFLYNRRGIVTIGGTAVLGLVVLVGGYFLLRSRQNKASVAFSSALATFHLPVVDPLPPDVKPNTPHFKTEEEKYQMALKEFSDVAQRYSWLSQGKLARYYVALCKHNLGKDPEAEKELTAIAGVRDRELGSLAKMTLARIYHLSDRSDEAEKLYRDLESHPTNTVPKATAQLALAELYQKTKPAQATALYQQLQKDYPGMAAGDQASKMLQAQTP